MRLILVILVSLYNQPASAEALDPSVVEAILGTQKALTSPAERQKAANTPAAKSAVQQVEILGGTPENSEAIFQLSSEIFGELANQTKGDPAKMEEILEKARRNPSEFAESLSPSLKSKLSEIAKKVPAPPTKLP